MPLPHISASLPSALMTRMRAAAILEGSSTMRPSAPTPPRRSQTRRERAQVIDCSRALIQNDEVG